jgi:hypothetical protein
MKPFQHNPGDSYTFILRKHFRAKLRITKAIRALMRRKMPLFEAISAIRTIRRKGHAVVYLPSVDDIMALIRDLDAAGIWGRRYGGAYRPVYPVPFENWKIGMEFWVGSGAEFPHRVTDVGVRTITAIYLDKPHDTTWYNGPPYAVAEMSFDENDLQVCYLEKPDGWLE